MYHHNKETSRSGVNLRTRWATFNYSSLMDYDFTFRGCMYLWHHTTFQPLSKVSDVLVFSQISSFINNWICGIWRPTTRAGGMFKMTPKRTRLKLNPENRYFTALFCTSHLWTLLEEWQINNHAQLSAASPMWRTDFIVFCLTNREKERFYPVWTALYLLSRHSDFTQNQMNKRFPVRSRENSPTCSV